MMHVRMLTTLAALSIVACGPVGDTADMARAESHEATEQALLRQYDGCDVIDAWVALHAREGLPRTYEGLAGLPQSYRLGIFNAETPEHRSDIVLMQADRYARLHPNLSASERAILGEAIDVLTPEVYENGPTPRTEDFENRAVAVFGERLVREVLPLLHADVGYEITEAPPRCECNTAKNDCLMAGGACKYGVVPCDYRPEGCGASGLASCNGICVRE